MNAETWYTESATTDPVPIALRDSGPGVGVPVVNGWSLPGRDRSSDAVPGEPTLTHQASLSIRKPLLFEVAWEVCNQVGGIYQVLRSKVPAMNERWGDRYYLVGPDHQGSTQVEFEPKTPGPTLASTLKALEAVGLRARYGRWLVTGRPRVILLDHRVSPERLSEMKYYLWADHQLELPGGDPLIDEVVSFAYAVRQLLEATSVHHPARDIIAHFHEWMGGLAIPLLRRRPELPIASVFTTHATILGRYMAPHHHRFYEELPAIDPAVEAERYLIKPVHSIERACAHGAHVFTTVSEVTGEECRFLLGRAPDLILPNGLNIERFDVKHQPQTHHADGKKEIHRFVRSHFFPYYTFDLDKTLYLFTAGRFEPHNKGFDLCLESMARLNAELKADGPHDITVVFFVITQRGGVSINADCLRNRGVIRELSDTCASITKQVGESLFDQVTTGKDPQLDALVDEQKMMRLRRTLHAWRRTGLPPVVTHDIVDAEHDPVLAQIRALWLDNAPEHPVKIVYHPEFITPANPIWKMDYVEFVRGSHLGVFPSAYEPWGYTPLECLAHSAPAISSDLAGFGRYVQTHFEDHDDWGAYVLPRRGRSFDESAADLTRRLLAYCRTTRRDRIALRNAVADHTEAFDWSRLARFYEEAHVRARFTMKVAD